MRPALAPPTIPDAPVVRPGGVRGNDASSVDPLDIAVLLPGDDTASTDRTQSKSVDSDLAAGEGLADPLTALLPGERDAVSNKLAGPELSATQAAAESPVANAGFQALDLQPEALNSSARADDPKPDAGMDSFESSRRRVTRDRGDGLRAAYAMGMLSHPVSIRAPRGM